MFLESSFTRKSSTYIRRSRALDLEAPNKKNLPTYHRFVGWHIFWSCPNMVSHCRLPHIRIWRAITCRLAVDHRDCTIHLVLFHHRLDMDGLGRSNPWTLTQASTPCVFYLTTLPLFSIIPGQLLAHSYLQPERGRYVRFFH
jgi:hypothetical protein